MSELKSGTSNTVSLLRNVANTTLNKAESIKDKFEITGWEITKNLPTKAVSLPRTILSLSKTRTSWPETS